MNSRRHLLWVAPFVLLACGGSVASTEQPGQPDPKTTPASPSGPEGPQAPSSVDPASTITFEAVNVIASRMPVNAGCDEVNASFSDQDFFALQAVAAAGSEKIQSIAINFHRTVAVGTALSLVDGPGGGATFEGARQAHSPDLKTGVDLVVFAPPADSAPSLPAMSALEHATVTVLQLPAKDGEPTSARVELHFADGGVLDATFSAPLVSTKGGCAEP